MIYTLIIILLGVSAIVGIVRPRAGAIFIWMFTWLYPNSLLYGTLPLNIRFDDLWVVYMFLICLILHRQASGLGRLTWLAILWWVSTFLGNMTGLLITGGAAWETIIKFTSKSLYVPMTTYVLSCLLDSPRSLEGHIKGLVLAGVLAGLLGIVLVYFPGPFSAFLVPHYAYGMGAAEGIEAGEEITRRAQGSVGTTVLAVIASSITLLALMLTVHQNRKGLRLFCGISCGALVATLGYTATRGAIGGTLAAVLWAIAFTRRRGVLISLAILGGLVLMWQGGLIDRIMLRVVGRSGGEEVPFLAGMMGRLNILGLFVDHFHPLFLVFGMGMAAAGETFQATVHNTYLGAFVYGGVLGAVVLVLVIARGIHLGRELLRAPNDPFSQAIGHFLLMLLVALMTYGVVAEDFQAPSPMQIFFAAMVFAEKRLQQVRAEQEVWLESYSAENAQWQPAA